MKRLMAMLLVCMLLPAFAAAGGLDGLRDKQQPSLPDLDPALLTRIMGLAGKAGPDRDQQALLCALQPYLAANRIQRLERAMRAAKLAQTASGFLGSMATPGR